MIIVDSRLQRTAYAYRLYPSVQRHDVPAFIGVQSNVLNGSMFVACLPMRLTELLETFEALLLYSLLSIPPLTRFHNFINAHR